MPSIHCKMWSGNNFIYVLIWIFILISGANFHSKITYLTQTVPLLWMKWSISGEKMTVLVSMEGNWWWGQMILRSLQKQMSFAVIGKSGNNRSYGNLIMLHIFIDLAIGICHVPLLLNMRIPMAGSKVQRMLWQLSFSWRTYILKWGRLLRHYLGSQGIFNRGLIHLESWWKLSYLLLKMSKKRWIGPLGEVQIHILHCTCACSWTSN